MATSGSTNFSLTRNQIINQALQLLGVYGVGRTVSSDDLQFCNIALNAMIKAWQNKGLYLWKKDEAYLFPTRYIGEYTLSADSTSARCAYASDTIITRLNGAHAASDTTLVVDDTTSMTAADIIGVPLTSGAIHWTTIVSVDSSTGLTITSGIATAASDNAPVYTFTSRVDKPHRILDARRISGVDQGSTSDRQDTVMYEVSHEEFQHFSNKTENGTPSHWYYQRGNTTGKLNVWQRPKDSLNYFGLTIERRFEDFDAASDDADFPSEWLEALYYQLAVRVASGFGKDVKLQIIAPLASTFLQNVLSGDAETASIRFSPRRR